MNGLTKDIAVSMFTGLLLPGLLLNFGNMVWEKALQTREENTVAAVESVSLPVRLRHKNETVIQGDMDTYLTGVVLAEMPAEFETEALKAQSVVARTYAWKAYTIGGKHGDGSVCTAPSCCQAWISEEEYLQQGGTPEAVEKIRSAVLSTAGQILTYEGEPIEATYFSCSGGSTEDALAVWGNDFPYLRAVNSPGEEKAAHYRDTEVFTQSELEQKLGITLSGHPESWIRSVTYTHGGGVESISVGGTFFTGVELRQKLGLRSTAFSMKAEGDSLAFTTRGYGHRVGMSQYGADAMAVGGSSCEEILLHYYQGAELTMLTEVDF